MPPFDVSELAAQNRSVRARRLKRLKKSVSTNNYQVYPDEIAGGILREVLFEAVCRKMI